MVRWECPTNPRETSGLDPEAVHIIWNIEIRDEGFDIQQRCPINDIDSSDGHFGSCDRINLNNREADFIRALWCSGGKDASFFFIKKRFNLQRSGISSCVKMVQQNTVRKPVPVRKSFSTEGLWSDELDIRNLEPYSAV